MTSTGSRPRNAPPNAAQASSQLLSFRFLQTEINFSLKSRGVPLQPEEQASVKSNKENKARRKTGTIFIKGVVTGGVRK